MPKPFPFKYFAVVLRELPHLPQNSDKDILKPTISNEASGDNQPFQEPKQFLQSRHCPSMYVGKGKTKTKNFQNILFLET